MGAHVGNDLSESEQLNIAFLDLQSRRAWRAGLGCELGLVKPLLDGYTGGGRSQGLPVWV
jgi:hypothetical protein